jgi:hypothetical protein
MNDAQELTLRRELRKNQNAVLIGIKSVKKKLGPFVRLGRNAERRYFPQKVASDLTRAALRKTGCKLNVELGGRRLRGSNYGRTVGLGGSARLATFGAFGLAYAVDNGKRGSSKSRFARRM